MPRIPTIDSIGVQANALPQVSARNVNTPELLTASAEEMRADAKATNILADVEHKAILEAQQRANMLRVEDAINRAKQEQMRLTYDKDAGYTRLRGLSALERPDGKPLEIEYREKFDDYLNQIESGLGNDAQRAEFRRRSMDIASGLSAGALKHEGDEFTTYTLSVREGTISSRMKEIALGYKDPNTTSRAIQEIEAATYDAANLTGKQGEVDSLVRRAASRAHTLALESALEAGDVEYAHDYLKINAKNMEADDILRARSAVTKQLDTKAALGAATRVMGEAMPRMQTSDIDRAWNILVNKESRGQQFDESGRPLTSPKGAIGIAQVMPNTAPEAAKLAGVEWDEERYKNDPAYNEQIGRAYFEKQLKDFDGDLAKAFAAYNAGPTNVRKAAKKAEEAGTPGDWLAVLKTYQSDASHRETLDYVETNLRKFEAGAGAYERPTRSELHTRLRETVGQDSPARLQLAQQELDRQYDAYEKQMKEQGEAVVASAMRTIVDNGGSFDQIPAHIVSRIPPEKLPTVMDFAKKIASGNDVTDLGVYNMLASDPAGLRGLTDDQFMLLRDKLSTEDFKKFSDQRGKAGKGGADELDTSAINMVLNDHLNMRGIDPTPKASSTEAQQVGAIRRFIRDRVLLEQTRTGKQLSSAEIENVVSQSFLQHVKSGWFGRTKPMLLATTGDIPGVVEASIRADFKRVGIENPTDSEVLDAYWRGLTTTALTGQDASKTEAKK